MKPAICNNNLQANIKAFREGKRDFNPQELNDIKLYLLKYKDHLESTQFFTGSLQEYSVASCFANNFQEELLDHMINKLQAAISIVVVMDEKAVLLKLNKNICNINLCKLAKLLCDSDCIEPAENIVQGKLTEKFLKFTTKLSPCT